MIIDGKSIAQERLRILADRVSKLSANPRLVALLVGDNPASRMYVSLKGRKAIEVGMASETLTLEENVSANKLIETINELNNDKSVTGILIQLPFPTEHLKNNQRMILDSIDPAKDVDGLTSQNMGMLALGKPKFIPATVKGIITLLFEVLKVKYIEGEFDKYCLGGKNIVVVGRSDIDGKPLAICLISLGATVTICNSKTINLKEHTLVADILITAVGKANLITADMVKHGAIVIDAGTVKNDNDEWVGDVDFQGVKDRAFAITPVPGGVGPMTVISLLENTFSASQ